MLRIPCPFCGERDYTEFRYGGDAQPRAARARLRSTRKAWHDYVFLFDNPKGPHREFWQHVARLPAVACARAEHRDERIAGRMPAARQVPRRTLDGEDSPERTLMTSAMHSGCRAVVASIAASTLGFSLDGRAMSGFEGDTLASALLANGMHARSAAASNTIARGVFCRPGVEEPNGLFTLGEAGRTRTECPAHDHGAVRRSRRRGARTAGRRSSFDLMAINSWVAPLLSCRVLLQDLHGSDARLVDVLRALHPPRCRAWAAQLTWRDPDRYETRHAFTDVLVIGAGPAGSGGSARCRACRCARTARRAGLAAGRQPAVGSVRTSPAAAWLRDVEAELEWHCRTSRSCAERPHWASTTANTVALVERRDHRRPDPEREARRARSSVTLRARTIVYATGATERPLVFANNDRPGVMLASAVRTLSESVRGGCWEDTHWLRQTTTAPMRRLSILAQAAEFP